MAEAPDTIWLVHFLDGTHDLSIVWYKDPAVEMAQAGDFVALRPYEKIAFVRAGLHEERVKLLGELVEAFDVYGAHGDMCSWWGTPPLKNCNCGYTDLLTRARQVGAR